MRVFIVLVLMLSFLVHAENSDIYYKVTNVDADDVLNMREKNHYSSKKINTLMPNEECIQIILDSPKWAVIKKNDKFGWVNKNFIKKSNKKCQNHKVSFTNNINIFDKYEHHKRIVGLALDEKNNLLASIDQDNILIIRTLNDKKILLKKEIDNSGFLKFSENRNYLNVISSHLTIYSFPNMEKKSTLKISDNLLSKITNKKNDFFQKQDIDNITIIEGEENNKHYGRKIYYKNKLIYNEASCGIMDFTLIAQFSKKNQSVFFVNGLRTTPSIYEIKISNGKKTWETSYASNAMTNTGGYGSLLVFNKREKLLYALEDIDYFDGEVVVWSMKSNQIIKTGLLSDFPSFPYIYEFAKCGEELQSEYRKDSSFKGFNCQKITKIPINKLYLNFENDEWLIGNPIIINKFIVHYDDAIISLLYNKNKKNFIKIIKDEMKKYSNTGLSITNDGFFSSGKNIPISLSQGLTLLSLNQFYDYFYRPDLIKLKILGKEKKYKNFIKNITYKTALKNPPPTIKIKETNKKTKKDKIKLSFNIKDKDGGVGLIRVYQEGKLIQTIGDGKVNKQSANIDTILEQEKDDKKNKENQEKEKLTELLKAKNGTLDISDTVGHQKSITTTNKAGDYEIELELISGKNEIGIEAFNKTNTVTSYRETIVIDADIPKKKPKLYAIVVGIDDFEAKPKKYHLNYAEKDALSIQKEIETKMGKTFDGVEVKALIGKEVSRANILKSAKKIAQKAKLEDTIIFYISTHGRAVKGNLYFAPYNNAQGSDWIDFEQTFKAIQSIKALNQIFIVDACESGQANDIVSAVYDSRASVLARSAGVHMLLATTKGAYAFEPNDKSKNVMTFTQRILKTLRDKSSDKDGDGFVSVVELSKSLKEPQNVVEYQYPVIRNVGGDVKLRRVE
ncbi:MAG TPA: caspase family protein [Crocinitomix sp.]|nr:caspase family protein [Crocinitomix sp.]